MSDVAPTAVPDPAPGPAARPRVVAEGPMAEWDAVETAGRITSGDVTATEVLDAALARLEEVDTRIGGLFHLDGNRAHEVLARRQRTGDTDRPLHGVPTAVKDLDQLAGMPTSFGSRATAGHVSGRTDAPVRQFVDTGLIAVGKSAAPEFGMTATGEGLGFAPTRNPWNPQHTVGGSSSGAASLVASRALPIAHAVDGGGSIRIPAACAGLVGLKPTYGRLVEDEDMRGLPVKVVSHGVVTRSVRDTAAFLAAAERTFRNTTMPSIAGVDGPGLGSMRRVAMITESATGPVDGEVLEAVERTGAALEALGHRVEPVALPFPSSLAEDFLLYWGALAQGVTVTGYAKVGRAFAPDQLDPWTRGLAGHFRSNLHRFPGAIRRLRAFRHDYATFTARYHVVLGPTLGTLPPELGWLSVDLPFEDYRERVERFVPFTPAWNVSGAPAVSLPMALSRSGLPIGVHLGAAHGDDRTLLELAFALEASAGFNRPLG
ncbi:amidase [Euzebya pacifica]|uniref:amidase n=1 Tax=Euzebya pacifica TaxID=1608957 RepID=UPI0030F81606